MPETIELKFERVIRRCKNEKTGDVTVTVGEDTDHNDPALNFRPTNAVIIPLDASAKEWPKGEVPPAPELATNGHGSWWERKLRISKVAPAPAEAAKGDGTKPITEQPKSSTIKIHDKLSVAVTALDANATPAASAAPAITAPPATPVATAAPAVTSASVTSTSPAVTTTPTTTVTPAKPAK
ncbi:hypothetical protein RvY_06887 [Ramazzottius varieornatus]|uniref:Uncharacterized protein n=1 Tax=Ramazzottius varieornatus TaxID=947166 RepID=A0A1D1V9R2_RAMVA|nr:hypothetical protein RvY_06887 [Ramazzottius varieornatus]